MKHPKVVLVLLLTVLTVLALNAGGCDTGEPPIYRNTSSPIYVGLNDEFVIALEANHTTGYSWQLTEEVDENILSLEGVEYEAGDSELVGAPGEEEWTFKAVGEGRTELTFKYVRPWETEEAEGEEAEAGRRTSGTETVTETHATTTETTTTETTTTGTEAATASEEEAAASEETMTYTIDVGPSGSAADKATEYKYEDGKIMEDEKEVPEAEVELGAQFALVVPSNPTTGYVWRLAEPLDGSLLILVSMGSEKLKEEGEKKEGEEEMVGVGYDEIWTFRAIGSHGDEATETEITLEKVRPWEEDTAPVDSVTLTVKITKPEEEKK